MPSAPAPGPPPDPLPLAGPWDVLVLGGGAAGLWAAGTAAARGRRVLLLEKNRRVGVKILASGGGACNLTTSLPAAEAATWFGPNGERFLRPAFRALSPQDLVEAFRTLGVPTHVEADMERVWPDSRKARDVADALVRRATAAGARIAVETPALGLRSSDEGFVVPTPRGPVVAPRAILAVGGMSYPRTGTTGDGYAWARELGHEVTPLAPGLVPLVVDLPWVHALRGIAVWVRARVVDGAGRVLFERHRPILFTHTGLSGPAAMDVSRWFTLAPPWRRPRLLVDFAPEASFEALRQGIDEAARGRASDALERVLPETLPERLRRALVESVGADPSRHVGQTPKDVRHAVVRTLKGLEVPVAGDRGFDYAEVTAGGVALDEVDPGTMASRKVPGLYVIGEILDLDGPIGGFNFQSAFATAELAGRAA